MNSDFLPGVVIVPTESPGNTFEPEMRSLIAERGIINGFAVGFYYSRKMTNGKNLDLAVLEVFARHSDAKRAAAALEVQGLGTVEDCKIAGEEMVRRVMAEALPW